MAPFSDPQVNQLMNRYYDTNCHPQFLYQGSEGIIIKELKTWIIRRKEVYKGRMKLMDESQKLCKAVMGGQVQALTDPARMMESLRENLSMMDRANVLDREEEDGTKRAVYLLHTLKSRGVTWPELWWRPDDDGGVCSFLGTVDKSFDAHATLKILEDREGEERILATRADICEQFDAQVKGWASEKAKDGNDTGDSKQTKG